VKTGTLLQGITALILLTTTIPGIAARIDLDTADTANGLTDIFSATFDGALTPCTGGDPAWCSFFNGKPGSPARAIVITPNPTGITAGTPGGITGAGAGSYLNLTINGNNVELTGGQLVVPLGLVLTISGSTVVTPSGIAGFVIDPGLRTAPLNASGQAEFLVSLAPSTAADFSTFSVIVQQPADCTGPLCALIPILTLDMIRYRLFIDYDPSFTSFTVSFIGQTANNSLLYATMNASAPVTAPEIVVTDSRAPADDLSVPFGSVTELTTASQLVTVTNTGNANLLMGAIAMANPLAAPFALANDTCTGATVLPAATCTFNVTFSPTSTGPFSDSLDIPSNDADESSVTVSVSGTGTAALVPNITVTDSVAPTADGIIPFGSTGVGTQLNQTVTITNDGNADLDVGSIAVANPLLAPYSIVNDNCSGQTVVPAASCTVGVRFEPTATGATSDTFDIPSNDVTDPTITFQVNGTGTSAATANIAVTDSVLPANDRLVGFGNVTENTSRDASITVTNSGGSNLVIGTVASANPLVAPFSIVTENCSAQTLAPAGTCTIAVRFAPTMPADYSDSLDIPSNDPDEASVTVSLTGAGIAAGQGNVETPVPSGADGGFMAIDPATLLLLGGAGVWGFRRRRAG
jgi:hypothetical protein